MGKSTARLSSAEIGGLWQNYIQNSMSRCLLKYFLHHLKDEEIYSILNKRLTITEKQLNDICLLFSLENIPIPDGFSDQDINLEAPPLFYEEFALSFLYMMSRMEMVQTAFILSNVARSDVLAFFNDSLKHSVDFYSESTTLMLSKGVYDRPPMIPYPKQVEYIEKKTFILPLPGKKRPLNTMELTELFFNIERNYFSILFCSGLLQVVKDKEIHAYIKKGRDISENQIKIFNNVLIKEDLLGISPVSMLVTDSTFPPFSNKFIVALFNFLNAIDVTLLGHALSMSMRADLSAQFSKFMTEILTYSEEGFNIMVNRGWLEQVPLAPNRKDLEKN
ncbi:DUF3231 family protein [Bacillus sp. CGMCC 1.16607]|uniref:DUF3231 family protein n=1 Tax=Bacillus sp. CGMCC 1.16607 TaxID=3351842 RepID=UPI00362D1A36